MRNIKRQFVRISVVGMMVLSCAIFIHIGMALSTPNMTVVNGTEGRSYTVIMEER